MLVQNDAKLKTMLQHLTQKQLDGMGELSEEMQQFVLDFGDTIYAHSGLDAKSRKIATISSLITSGNHEQIRWHITGGLSSGLITQQEVLELIYQMILYIGFPAAFNAMRVAKEVFAELDSGA